MSEAYVLSDKINSQQEWDLKNIESKERIVLPSNPSAFPKGLKELSESRVNILCGVGSQPCSG